MLPSAGALGGRYLNLAAYASAQRPRSSALPCWKRPGAWS